MMPGSSSAYVMPEEIERARQMDLFSFLQKIDPGQLVHVAGQTYCTLEHDSLKINNGKWYWHSRGFGGVSALDYLIKVKGYPLPRAVELILGRGSLRAPAACLKIRPDKGNLILPEKEVNSGCVAGYLNRRGIHPSIITYCLENKTLYESKKYHNAVFVGFDKDRVPRYEDTIIIAECGIEMAKKWRAERRAYEFRESGKREKEYELVSFHALFSDGDKNDDEWLADDKNLVEETALKNIQYEDLYRALGELSPVGRQVIVKYYVEDDQEGEIAASLGLSRGEVNNIKRKALRRLRKLLS